MKRLIFVLLISAMCISAYADIASPVSKRLQSEGAVFLGIAGPGQTVKLAVAKECEGKVWDRLYIISESLPTGWEKEDGLWYESPMQASIKIGGDAPNGEYTIKAKLVDEYEGLGEMEFFVTVNVSREVFDVEVLNPSLETGVGQPGAYKLILKNLGTASDVFRISVKGMPAWIYTKTVVVPRSSEKEVIYEIVANERGSYPLEINVTSISSELIGKQSKVSFTAQPSLISNMKACANGMLMFPIPLMSIYSLIGFISNFI